MKTTTTAERQPSQFERDSKAFATLRYLPLRLKGKGQRVEYDYRTGVYATLAYKHWSAIFAECPDGRVHIRTYTGKAEEELSFHSFARADASAAWRELRAAGYEVVRNVETPAR